MKRLLEEGLRQLGKESGIISHRGVAGGDINEAFYVQTEEQEYFVKLNRSVTSAFFKFEKRGLQEIGKTGMIAVPEVYGAVTAGSDEVPMLWLEWIEGREAPSTGRHLGEQLAAMHGHTVSGYGLEGISFIGRLEQESRLLDSWLAYYRDFRLAGQLQIGREKQTIGGSREIKLASLLDQLHRWIPEKPEASLLHGDLWGGNWMAGSNGQPVLIDPSVLYGDSEFEIAFTRLFGGFPERFYSSYTAIRPLSDVYTDKEPLYQLYYLLAHLNMFGEIYGGAVDRILDRYVG